MVLQAMRERQIPSRHLQVPTRQCPTVTLSKEAREALLGERRDRSHHFHDDPENVWSALDKATVNIASTHHKSIQCVQRDLYFNATLSRKRTKVSAWNAFFWKKSLEDRIPMTGKNGKTILPGLVQEYRHKYQALSAEDKDTLVKEFKEHKHTKMTGYHVRARSRLNSLRCRTGMETLLFAVRGSTDITVDGVSFATPGVEGFLGMVMGIDNLTLVSKMEGFAIQGIKGAARNHQDRVSHVRSSIREIINRKLREITGNPDAKMQWSAYFARVVSRYLVIVDGWPDNIPFVNLSSVSSSLPQLERLLNKWETGEIQWKCITQQELSRMQDERCTQLETGQAIEPKRRTHSDKGKTHKKSSGNQARQRQTFKSTAVIGNSDGEDGDVGHTTALPDDSNGGDIEQRSTLQSNSSVNTTPSNPSNGTATGGSTSVAIPDISNVDFDILMGNIDTFASENY
ncbi:hypothetical protein EDD15DRAFT_2197644 [Pisolithus albus]|nr:hypothetical protein EDD15DRAFT_2197644 [Pisolithus albus]